MQKNLKKYIICPKCKKKILIKKKYIICKKDKILYKLKNNIFILLNNKKNKIKS